MATSSKIRIVNELQQQLRAVSTHEVSDHSSESEKDVLESCTDNETEEDANDGDYEPKTTDEDMELEVEAAVRGKTVRRRCKVLFGKNRYKWSTEPAESRERPLSTVFHLPKGKGDATNVRSPLEAWSLLMPDDLLNSIVTHTNEEIARKRKHSVEQTYTSNVDLLELKAVLGLLYFSGLNKDAHNNTTKMWSVLSSPLYRSTMPRNRFAFLLQIVRFDDRNTREERRQSDKLAPIRDVWEMFISKCQEYYSPHQYCTIGEQLLNFRGRCGFRIYMRSKSDRYGLKIVTLNDAKTFYMVNASPYVGDVNTQRLETVPSYYVRTLSEPIHGSGRNITCSSWYMSVPIVEKMKNEFNLTMVGTIRKDKREIPDVMKRSITVGRSQFAYRNNNTLVSYCPKKRKITLLLSSLHSIGKIDEDTGKPEIVNFYNRTKDGTETFEQMCHEYTTTRATRRWPLRFFYGILDQCAMNAFILFQLNVENEKKTRAEFLEELALTLIRPILVKRVHTKQLRLHVRLLIESVLNVYETPDVQDATIDYKLDKRVRCGFCPYSKDRKTQVICPSCRTPRCDEHRSVLCADCAPINE